MEQLLQQNDKQSSAVEAISASAMQAFALYGFRRTSMEEIAQGAGMSRPALYLHFRNKEDIFRNLARGFFEQVVPAMAQALARPGSAEQILTRAFVAKDGDLLEQIMQSPHGSELLDAGFSISADIVADAEAKMAVLLSDFFTARGVPDGLGSGDDIAKMVMVALRGLKVSSKTFAEYREGQIHLARLVARAIDKA